LKHPYKEFMNIGFEEEKQKLDDVDQYLEREYMHE
jgi:hypothetical protein